jgi:hypothetical protein
MLVNNCSTRNAVAPKENLAGSPAAVFTSKLCVAEAMTMPPSSDLRLLDCTLVVNKPHAIAFREECWLRRSGIPASGPGARVSSRATATMTSRSQRRSFGIV